MAVEPAEGGPAEGRLDQEGPPGADGRAPGHVDGEGVDQLQVDVRVDDVVEVAIVVERPPEAVDALIDDLFGLSDGDAQAAVTRDDAAEGVAVREEVALEVLADHPVAYSIGFDDVAQKRVEVRDVPAHQEAGLLGVDRDELLVVLGREVVGGCGLLVVLDHVDGNADVSVVGGVLLGARVGASNRGRNAFGVGGVAGWRGAVRPDVVDDGQFGADLGAFILAVAAGLSGYAGHGAFFRVPIGMVA